MIPPRRSGSALVTPCLLSLLLPLLACHPDAAGGPSPDPATSGATQGRAAALAALADAIDPGPVAPMSADLPPVIAEQVAVDTAMSADEREALIRSTAAAFTSPQRFALLTQVASLVALARSVALLEGRVVAGQASPADLVDLLTLYAALDQPVFAHEQGTFAQFLPTVLAAARASGADDLDEVEAFASTVFDRMRRAEPLRRAVVAQLLRAAPDDPAIPEVLAGIADNLGRRDPALARAAVELARDLDPAAGPARHLDVAYRCSLVIDLACADAAIEAAAAGALDDDTRARLASTRETRATAGLVAANESASDLDGRLTLARALFDLGLYARAKPVFEALHAEFPRDARPVTGLARIEVASKIDVAAAARWILDAGPLDHQDAEYYEIAIAAQVLQLFNVVLPRVMQDGADLEAELAQPLARLRVEIEGFERHGSELAQVLRALLDLTERGLPLLVSGDRGGQAALLRAALDEALALQRRLPNEPHAFILLMAAAELMPDKQAAVAAASTPVPAAGGAALHLRKAQALVNLASTWADPSLLPAVEPELEAIPEGELVQQALLTAANMYAIAGRLEGRPEYLQEAVELYYAGFQQFQDPTAVNNLGVLLVVAGDPDQARAAFESAIALAGDKSIVAQLNLALLDSSAAGTAAIEAIAADEGNHGSVRRLAMTALAARAEASGDRKGAGEWAKRRAASLAEPSLLPRTLDLPNAAGVLLLGQLAFDVSYSIEGLQLTADAASTAWLVPSR